MMKRPPFYAPANLAAKGVLNGTGAHRTDVVHRLQRPHPAAFIAGFCLSLVTCGVALATQPSAAEKRLSAVSARELVSAAKTGRVLTNCFIPGAAFDEAFRELLKAELGPSSDDIPDRSPGIRIEKCAIYPANFHAKGVANFKIAIRDSVFKESEFSEPGMLAGFTFSNIKFPRDVVLVGNTFEVRVAFVASEFGRDAVFFNNRFMRSAAFDRTKFKDGARFGNSRFDDVASFSGAEFEKGSEAFGGVEFSDAAIFEGTKFATATRFQDVKFAAEAIFDRVRFKELRFHNIEFPRPVYFRGAREIRDPEGDIASGLRFISTTFRSYVFLDDANVMRMAFEARPEATRGRYILDSGLPTVFEKDVSFRKVTCDLCDLKAGQFRGKVAFDGSTFHKLDVSRSAFLERVSIANITIRKPSEDIWDCGSSGNASSGFYLDESQFERGLTGRAPSLAEAIVSKRSDTWESVADMLKRGNYSGELRARYCASLVDGMRHEGWDRMVDRVDYYFWGYQTKPERVIAWALLWWLLFAAVYFPQTRPLGRVTTRALYAMRFSAERCIQFDLRGASAKTSTYKVITIAESLGAKIIGLLFLKAIASRFPALDGVIGKLLPF